ncbi:MAG: carbohydrate ABC transporter permease [Paenibacillaceae bacterium]|nr:carbohydrate ABC transporter permease [Paenibacillaceae bacterium]
MLSFKSDRLFQSLNNALFVVFSLLMLLPMFHLLALSLSSNRYIQMGAVYLWPKGFNLAAFEYIVGQERLWRALGVSIYITAVGTAIALFLTLTLSYALSRAYMPGKGLILKLILLTFIFPVAMIPYFLVVKQLHLLDTLWSLMLPNALGAWYVFITKTFFQGLSNELFEAGRIDGCNEYALFWRIAMPLSMPVVATIGLFYAVNQWNSYFDAIIFVRDQHLYPIQMLVREIAVVGNMTDNMEDFSKVAGEVNQKQVIAGVILFASFPIMLVYPFLQKYFVKGAMLGSLKE